MNGIIIGESLDGEPGELTRLVEAVQDGRVTARKVDHQADGDVRYWAVDASQSAVLQRLLAFSERCFVARTGAPPVRSIIMINVIDAARSPNGSGGGWHRDSFTGQYKGFAYLTDVLSEAQGAFAFVPRSNNPALRLVSFVHRITSHGNRHSDAFVDNLGRIGFASVPVLLKAGLPFFVDTSLIHRGLPIVQGRRLMATVYMYDEAPKDAAPLM